MDFTELEPELEKISLRFSRIRLIKFTKIEIKIKL